MACLDHVVLAGLLVKRPLNRVRAEINVEAGGAAISDEFLLPGAVTRVEMMGLNIGLLPLFFLIATRWRLSMPKKSVKNARAAPGSAAPATCSTRPWSVDFGAGKRSPCSTSCLTPPASAR